MEKRTNTYHCTDDQGRKHVVYEFTEIIAAGHSGNPHATIKGMKRLATHDGNAVNYKSEGVFEIVRSGTRITVD
ncbi:MAG: hypothetical protein ABNH17_07395 [Paracoccus sp. (in: a-proteobacteria)]|jgi:hypothetical protein|uniref:hypothetical protein n=1 Tax=Paracoccus sp. TaxID=267 RepID=UPI0032D93B2F